MVTHKKTKKKRILMMRMKKLIAKEIINKSLAQEDLNDSSSIHK
ncbi:MAG: hypothetical protein ACRCWG_14315 [Sarcina sp.]